VTLRDYQDRALSNVEREWSAGNSRVCLVSPTGSGKTRMGSEAVHRGACPTIWLTHRNELVDQSAAALRALGVECGEFAANRELTPRAVQVCSWQTLIARPREQWPPCELLVIDECHHAAAEEWRKPLEALGAKRTLGLTATPQRGDGKPLDMFDALVVAASYSALLKAGHLVPCRVFRPEKLLAPDLGSDPLTEYQKRAPGLSAIGFARNEEHCRELAERFTAAGYPSSAITYNSRNRAELIRLFRAGAIKVLWSVQVSASWLAESRR
jgi:superfamily II DNA or RNA helicase